MPAEISARSVATGARMRCASAAAESVWYYMVLYYMVLLRYFGICRRRVAASQVYVDALLAPRQAALAHPAFALTSQRRLASAPWIARERPADRDGADGSRVDRHEAIGDACTAPQAALGPRC
jgi:hypothetical protein